jgi:hypothetical protein
MPPSSNGSTELGADMSAIERIAAIDGWFTLDEQAPALIGNRCTTCGTYVFPPTAFSCPNPDCGSATTPEGAAFESVELSRRGHIWSYTDARYQPPPPYVAADPYQPFCLAAVELAEEKLVVLGQVSPGFKVGDLHVGMEVELVLGKLDSGGEGGLADDPEIVVWNWNPIVEAGGEGS